MNNNEQLEELLETSNSTLDALHEAQEEARGKLHLWEHSVELTKGNLVEATSDADLSKHADTLLKIAEGQAKYWKERLFDIFHGIKNLEGMTTRIRRENLEHTINAARNNLLRTSSNHSTEKVVEVDTHATIRELKQGLYEVAALRELKG